MLTFLKSLAFLILVPGTVVIYVPLKLSSGGPANAASFGALPLWLAGAAAVVWCVWDFTFTGRGTPLPLDPPRALVGRGLYRYTRNPMYLGAVLILAGHVVWFQTLSQVWYAVAVWLAFHGFVVFYEEPHLRRTFGDAYQRYCQTVPRWFPRWRPRAAGPDQPTQPL